MVKKLKDLSRRKLAHKKEIDLLIEVFLSIKTREKLIIFLRDLLTAQELRMLSRRLKIAEMLNDGQSFREIMFELDDVGVNTIARVNSEFESGNGYKSVLK